MQLTSRESIMPRAATNSRRSTPSGNRLGERVRQLRVAAGLTQTDLAGDRLSKEYVSQIQPGPDARRGTGVLRCRPRRPPLAPDRLPLPALQHLDRGQPPLWGAEPGRGLRACVRPPPRRHHRPALTVLPTPAGLRTGARGR